MMYYNEQYVFSISGSALSGLTFSGFLYTQGFALCSKVAPFQGFNDCRLPGIIQINIYPDFSTPKLELSY